MGLIKMQKLKQITTFVDNGGIDSSVSDTQSKKNNPSLFMERTPNPSGFVSLS
jgi:hypothetical protein